MQLLPMDEMELVVCLFLHWSKELRGERRAYLCLLIIKIFPAGNHLILIIPPIQQLQNLLSTHLYCLSSHQLWSHNTHSKWDPLTSPITSPIRSFNIYIFSYPLLLIIPFSFSHHTSQASKNVSTDEESSYL